MTAQSRSSLGRALLLVLLMLGLGGLLYWQRLSIHQAALIERENNDRLRKQAVANVQGVEARYLESVDDLSEKRMAEAKAATSRIAALKKERTEASRWPNLLVPTPLNAQTAESIQAAYTRFRLRELDVYRRLTEDTGETKQAAEAFLDAYLQLVANRLHPSNDYSKLSELGQAAETAGSRDPMFRIYYAFVKMSITGDTNAARATWTEMLEILPRSPYPQMLTTYARLFIYDIADDSFEKSNRWKEAIPSLIAWLEEEASTPEWFPSVCERMWGLLRTKRSQERQWFLVACLQSTKMDPYIPHALAGSHFIDSAWSRRGGGWAVDVKPEQWDGFKKYLDRARTHLEYAWVLHPELPYAPERLIPVAMADGVSEQPYFWFLRTIEARFDEPAAYNSLEYALSSRWGGSRKDMLTFGQNCAETLRFDTAIPYRMLDMLWQVKRLELDDEETLASEFKATAMLRRFLQLRAAYRASDPNRPMYEDDGHYRADILLLLEECGLEAEALAFLQSGGGPFYWSRLRSKNRPGRYLAALTLASQKDFKDRVRELDRQLRLPIHGIGEPVVLERLEAELQSLQQDIDLDPSTDRNFPDFFQQATAILAQRRAYNTGDWCPLETSASLAGWEPYCDEWFPSPEGHLTLSGRYGSTTQICLRPLANFQPPIEVEVDVEMLDPPPYLKRAGIGWSREGLSNYSERGGNLPLFDVTASQNRNRQTQTSSRHDMANISYWEGHQSSNHPLIPGQKHHLRLKLWPNFAEYRADDAWYAVPLPHGLHPDGWLCFGEAAPVYTSGVRDDTGAVQFSNMRVRRLPISAPPESTAPLGERSTYWEARYQADPRDIVTIVGLIGVRADQARHDDVLRLVKEAQSLAPEAQRVRRWKAMALKRLRRYAEALEEFDLAAADWSDDDEAVRHVAEIRAGAPDAALRDGLRARQSAEYALRRLSSKREPLETLAAAHAEMGDFDKAIEVQQQALDAEAETADAQSAVRLEAYRQHQPWRLPALDTPVN